MREHTHTHTLKKGIVGLLGQAYQVVVVVLHQQAASPPPPPPSKSVEKDHEEIFKRSLNVFAMTWGYFHYSLSPFSIL